MRVGIIGGGVTGLTAAYQLGKQGYQVDVFESAPFLGGQASTFNVGGGKLERGYHHIFMSDYHLVELIQELGLEPRLRWIESSMGFYHAGRTWQFGSPYDLANFRPLSVFDRIRLGLVTLYLQKTKNWSKFENITAKDWLQSRVGKQPYDIVWGPMLRGKFGDQYEKVGMVWLWNKMYLRMASRKRIWDKEQLGYPIGSFSEIFDALYDRICTLGGTVSISSNVQRILVDNDRVSGLEVSSSNKEKEIHHYDAVISTVPSYVFSRLVPTLPERYQFQLSNVTYLPAVLMILVLNQPFTNFYWLNIADRSIPFVGLIEHTNLIDPAHYGGNHIVYISNYPSINSDIYTMGGPELFEYYIPYLQKINPAFNRSWVVDYHHHKVDAAQPIIGVNYSDKIPNMRTPIRGVYLANTTQIYPEDRGTNYSVRLGKQAAEFVIEDTTR